MTLAKNKDRALRYEQTFNIVNLEEKLKGLEDKPGFPRARQVNLGREDVSKTNTHYNIISNLDFADHHYLPPDKRPARQPLGRPKTQTISAIEYKDYDLIAHRYLRDHESKTKYDQEFYKAEAAQKYWATHDFDPIVGSYIDTDKEKAYCEEREAEQLTHGLDQVERLPKSIKYSESALFNPINSKVVDAGRLDEIDLKNKNAKKRYGARHSYEQECRERDLEVESKELTTTISRVDHRRYIEHRDRGYNIVTLGPFDGRFAEKFHEPYTKPKESLWQATMQEALPRPDTTVIPRAKPIEREVKRQPTDSPHLRSASSHPQTAEAKSRGTQSSSHSKRGPTPRDITFINNGQLVTSVREVATPAAPRLRSSGFKRD